MEHWYTINLKQPAFLSDPDYQDYVLFNLFRYVESVDVSLINPPYQSISALFDSENQANAFCVENENFVQSISRQIDREMLTQRIMIKKKL